MKKNLFTILVIISFQVKNVLAAHQLPEFNAQYAVIKFHTKVAQAQYQLAYTQNGYIFTQNTQLYGLAKLLGNDTVSATSYIKQINNQLFLEKHTYIQTGREKNKNENIQIKWKVNDTKVTGQITGVVRSKKINLTTTKPVWDALSFQLPLMLQAKSQVKKYPLTGILVGKSSDYNFYLHAVEKIDFSDTSYKTLHLVHQEKNNRQLHIWLIPALHNIPVLIKNFRDGKLHSSMELESIKFNQTPTFFANNQSDEDDD